MTGIDGLLQELDVAVAAFAVCEVRAGWHLDAPALGAVSAHYVLRGHGRLHLQEGRTLDFAPRSVLICPPGVAMRISVRSGEPPDAAHCVPVRTGLEWLSSGGDPALPRVLIACGSLTATMGFSRGLFDNLGTPLHLASGNDERLSALFEELLAELAQPEPGLGSRALTDAIMKQGLVVALRRLAEEGDGRLPWLRGLAEPGLAAAVNAVLEDPGRRFSIEQLAEIANIGRSTFIHRFKDAFGMPPRQFLAEQRLRLAARLLLGTSYPVKSIAAEVGYKSRSHFSKAFKAHTGQNPESYRSQQGREIQ